MKKLLPFLLLIVISGCRKQQLPLAVTSSSLAVVLQTALKDSLLVPDWAGLDWRQVQVFHAAGDTLYARIGFTGQPVLSDFVLVRLDAAGRVHEGRIIHLDRAPGSTTGRIRSYALDRSHWMERPLRQGRPRQQRPSGNAPVSPMSLPYSVQYDYLDEVVVIGYTSSGSYIDYYNFQCFFSGLEQHTGNGGAYYGSAEGVGAGYPPVPGSAGGGGGGMSPVGSNTPPEDMLELEAEYTDALASIDIRKYFNCFDQVPSAGARYSIQLCTDIPINSNAEASARLLGGVSPGHSFLVVTKSNGTQKITQSFGFYPEQTPSVWDPFGAVKSSLKDNGATEINASITMNISESEFNLVKQKAIENSTHSYLLVDYNCTDYALSVFNAVRSTPLPVSPFAAQIPAVPGMTINPITFIMRHAPQAVFMGLQEMKNQNNSEAGSIQIDVSHNYRAPISYGECN